MVFDFHCLARGAFCGMGFIHTTVTSPGQGMTSPARSLLHSGAARLALHSQSQGPGLGIPCKVSTKTIGKDFVAFPSHALPSLTPLL